MPAQPSVRIRPLIMGDFSARSFLPARSFGPRLQNGEKHLHLSVRLLGHHKGAYVGIYSIGASIFDVRTKRGGGVKKYPKFVEKKYIHFANRGGEGVKKFLTSYMDAPLT